METSSSSIRHKFSSITADSVITYSIALMMGVMFFDHTNALAIGCYFTAMAAWISKWVRERRVLVKLDFVGSLLLLLLANALLSSIFSYDAKYSFRELRGEMAKMVPFYFLILSNITTNRSMKTILKAIFAGAFIMSIIGVLGYFTGLTLYRERTISLFANESYGNLGLYLLITSCLLFGQIIYEKNKKKSLLYLFLLIVYFSCILATLTRSIWLGFFSAVAIASFFYRKKLLLLFPVIILTFFLLFPSTFTNRLKSIFDFQSYGKPGGVLSDRVQLWKSGASMVRDNPILGMGYGKRIFKKTYIEEDYILPEAKERKAMPFAHNFFLDIAIQLGIPGLIIFLFMLVVFFKEAVIAYKGANDLFSKGILLGCLLAMFEVLQTGLTGNFFYDENGLYTIFLMAIAMSLRHTLKTSEGNAAD